MNKFLISDNNLINLCKIIFKILNCNVLWVIYLNKNILVTDTHILEHYIDKKYYLTDPNIQAKTSFNKSKWKVTLGTYSDDFNKNDFLSDLHRIFNIEEFASIETKIKSEQYCFRFFTKNNRFVFINKLLNNFIFIKYFINVFTKRFNKVVLC